MAKLLDSLYALFTGLTADDTPVAADDYVMTVDASASALKKVLLTDLPGGSGGGALTTASDALTADVTMTSANTYYDGPSVSLAPGTWLVMGTVSAGTGGEDFTAKLWDGTNTFSSGMASRNVNGFSISIALSAIVSPAETTTYKISVACDAAGQHIEAELSTNGAGNTASTIWAVKIG